MRAGMVVPDIHDPTGANRILDSQTLHQRIAIDCLGRIHQTSKHEQSVRDTFARPWNTKPRYIRKRLPQYQGVDRSDRGPIRQLVELLESDRSLHACHPQIASESDRATRTDHRSRPRLPVVTPGPGPIERRRIANAHHAPLATGRHNLVLTKRERCRMPKRSNMGSPNAGTMRLCAILDDQNTVRARPLHDGRHVAGPTRKMNHDRRPSSLGSTRFKRLHSDVPAGVIDINERCPGSHMNRCRRIRDVRPRRYQHLVPGSDSEPSQAQFDRECPVGNGKARATNQPAKGLLEIRHFRTCPLVGSTRSKHLGHGRDLDLTVAGPTRKGYTARTADRHPIRSSPCARCFDCHGFPEQLPFTAHLGRRP